MGRKVVFTESQIEELKEMMSAGKRQSEIAKHFQVTDDTIRRICKENGLNIKMPYKCTCAICGEIFYSNVKTARTCKKEHHRNCIVCGADFVVDRDNIKETCSRKCSNLLKYGVAHHLQSDTVKKKRQETVKEKYGVCNISQLQETKDKSRQTQIEKYGSLYMQTEEGQQKRRATNLEKYGYEEPFANEQYRLRCDEINLERYGTVHPMQTEEIQAKQQATLLKHYGVDNPMKSAEIVAKLRSNNVKKFGFHTPMEDPEVRQKVSQTVMDRYGVPWACMRPEARQYSNDSGPNRIFADLLNEAGITFEREFPLKNFSFDFKIGDTLIEIDPTGTHNSYQCPFNDTKEPNYHYNKTKLAEENGYRCIHVFDWDNIDAVIELVKLKEPIYARNCIVKQTDRKTAEEFTSRYHIQGSCKGQNIVYGLFYQDELVEIMSFGNPRYTKECDLELLRLCTKHGIKVIGGASKLFKAFRTENPKPTILSYCNYSKFNGEVYEQIGMKHKRTTSPNIVWSKKTDYITDNYLRQRGYDQIFGTNYGKNTSNAQLMIDHGWKPVYDCGQKVFVTE